MKIYTKSKRLIRLTRDVTKYKTHLYLSALRNSTKNQKENKNGLV